MKSVKLKIGQLWAVGPDGYRIVKRVDHPLDDSALKFTSCFTFEHVKTGFAFSFWTRSNTTYSGGMNLNLIEEA